MRATDEIFEPARMEGINFVSYSAPIEYMFNDKGEVSAVKFEKNLPKNSDPDNLKYGLTGDIFSLPCDHVVQSFGCTLSSDDYLTELKKSDTLLSIDSNTQRTKKYDWLFVGGDAVGTKNLVDAVNDGKTASWYMHKSIQESNNLTVPATPQLPGFFTEIDAVDLQTEICGVKM